jgi:hypothetical protein
VEGFGVLRFAQDDSKDNGNSKYRGLSTTAAKYAASGRDDVLLEVAWGRGKSNRKSLRDDKQKNKQQLEQQQGQGQSGY